MYRLQAAEQSYHSAISIHSLGSMSYSINSKVSSILQDKLEVRVSSVEGAGE